MVLKIEPFCPKEFEIGQKDTLEETPDFKSKLFITALIISPIRSHFSLSKSIRAWSHINLCVFMNLKKVKKSKK